MIALSATYLRAAAFCVLVVIWALLVVVGTHAAPDAHQPRPQAKTACFPARSWDAARQDRPCTTVVRPDNDRVRVIQGTPTSRRAVCVVNTANVNDARCHRTRPAPTRAVLGRAICSRLRVCAVIGRTQEDGSVNVTITSHLHPIEVCALGNPSEERGHYTQPCWRPTPTGPTHPTRP